MNEAKESAFKSTPALTYPSACDLLDGLLVLM
jgi:hypothetical protein